MEEKEKRALQKQLEEIREEGVYYVGYYWEVFDKIGARRLLSIAEEAIQNGIISNNISRDGLEVAVLQLYLDGLDINNDNDLEEFSEINDSFVNLSTYEEALEEYEEEGLFTAPRNEKEEIVELEELLKFIDKNRDSIITMKVYRFKKEGENRESYSVDIYTTDGKVNGVTCYKNGKSFCRNNDHKMAEGCMDFVLNGYLKAKDSMAKCGMVKIKN